MIETENSKFNRIKIIIDLAAALATIALSVLLITWVVFNWNRPKVNELKADLNLLGNGRQLTIPGVKYSKGVNFVMLNACW